MGLGLGPRLRVDVGDGGKGKVRECEGRKGARARGQVGGRRGKGRCG